MTGSIILGKNRPSVRSDMRYNKRQEDIILVAHGIYCLLKANNWCFGEHRYASKHHDRATTMSILARFWTFHDISREINEESNARVNRTNIW